MKTCVQSLFITLGVLVGFSQVAQAAVNLTVTPSAVSNTYNGTITLQVTGLTNTETVVVQKFLDANTNGVVDAGDLLMQQFQVTDGSASVFYNGATPVTNFNVPGDTDGAVNGQITAKLYLGFDFSQLIVGKYLFVLSSPVGHFAPVTKPFSVTNCPFAQSFSGNVVNSGTNVPNAVVLLFQPSDGGENPQGGVVANNSGAYAIKAPSGDYQLGAFKSNFVANLSVSPYVTLSAGATITTNVAVTNATQSISGNVIDVNNSSIGLAGYLVPVQSTNNLLVLAFTDTNGIYTARVVPSLWKIGSNDKGLAYKGYLSLQNSTKVDTTAGSVSGVTIALPKATAVFYGTVKDALGNPLPGITALYSSDNNDNYETDGYTDTSGNYVAGAVGGLNNDQWQVGVDDSSLTNYVFSQSSTSVTLSIGQAYPYDFTALLAMNLITGYVQDANGNPITGVGVNANYGSYSAHTDTDSNGNYSLNVANGTWDVSLNCCNDCGDGLGSQYQCPADQNVTMNNNNGTANFVVLGANAGQIFGYVTDAYGDGVRGVTIYANDGIGDVYTNSTQGSGYYSLAVSNGNWAVSVDCGELNSLDYLCVGTSNVNVFDDSVEQDFSVLFWTTPRFTFTTLHGLSMTATNNDGAYPYDALLLSDNTLYGTANGGGTNGTGTLFAFNTNAASFTVLHSFAATDPITGTNSDGANPYARLILSGNTLYSTASDGGTNGNGTVFKVTTNGMGFTVLHSFTATDPIIGTNSDGANPSAALILSGNTLYGTATDGGTNGAGTVFALNTNGTGFTVLHTFTALDTATETTNSDGAYPDDALVLSGNTLYGTATRGGTNGTGTVFALNTNGTGFAVLHTFTALDTATETTNSDGANPYDGLLLSGNTLYGTAASGGTNGSGTVFDLNTNGTGFAVLHAFTGTYTNSAGVSTNSDGANPYGGLILLSNLLYSTTINGGSAGEGTVFGVNTNGTGFTVLHTFTALNNFTNSDGANPYAGLILSGSTLYSTANDGGTNGNGTVFSVSLVSVSAPPQLTIIHSGTSVFLAWPTNAVGFTLQTTTNLVSPVAWTTNSSLPVVVNGQYTVTNSISGTRTFYRLSQ